MKTNNKKDEDKSSKVMGSDFFEHLWERSWTYIKTVVDVVREPVLILDENLHVMAGNLSFYETFNVKPGDTEGVVVYELGNGQWNIPSLRKLLEDILPKHTFFKGFQVAHEFPSIGRKVMILNARQIHFKEDDNSPNHKSLILLAMEDVTEMMVVAETLAGHAKNIESKLMARAQKMETHIVKLEKEISDLKNKPGKA